MKTPKIQNLEIFSIYFLFQNNNNIIKYNHCNAVEGEFSISELF